MSVSWKIRFSSFFTPRKSILYLMAYNQDMADGAGAVLTESSGGHPSLSPADMESRPFLKS